MASHKENQEKKVKVDYRIPESLEEKIKDRAWKLTKKKRGVVVTKTSVAIELMEIGLLHVK